MFGCDDCDCVDVVWCICNEVILVWYCVIVFVLVG